MRREGPMAAEIKDKRSTPSMVSGGGVRWAVKDGVYTISYEMTTTLTMEPGLYDIYTPSAGGLYFSKVDMREDQLLVFPNSDQSKILDDITTFWSCEEAFLRHDVPFKRGIMLWGPPGSGKSSLLRLISQDVISRGGIVLQFSSTDLFVAGYRMFREVQPDTPIVVLMEDLDTIFTHQNESKLLNLLDGAELAEKTIFLATTNYPEKLGARIMNRPSRFDRVYKIPHPDAEARKLYLDTLAGGEDVVPSARWARETEGLSLSHVKELFIGSYIMGGNDAEIIDTLRGMRVRHSSGEGDDFVPAPTGAYI